MDDRPESFTNEVYRHTSSSVSVADVQRRLAAVAPWYRHFLRPWLPDDRGALMLDVPCGPGNLLHALVGMGFTNVHGFDADAGQVEMARRLKLPASEGDAFEVVGGYRPGSVSRVFTLDFFEHVEPERATELARLAHVALEPGGYLVARTPSADGPFGAHDRHNDLTHRWAMTYESAHVLVGLAGFEPRNLVIQQEAPVPYKWQNVVRRGLFQATTRMAGALLELCGIGAPKVWTRSMWIIVRK